MSSVLQPSDTITRILKQHPAAARVFERHGMDYCCAGGTTLEAACAERGTDVGTLIRDLEDLIRPAAPGADPATLSLPELAEHIRSTHHAYIREELPRLDAMTERVALVHGARNPRLQAVHETWRQVAQAATAHLEKEDRFLLPAETPPGSTNSPAAATGEDAASLRTELKREHARMAEGIGRLRELTENYIAPPWACGTYRAMLEALTRFDADASVHLRTEETWLFPRITEHAPADAERRA